MTRVLVIGVDGASWNVISKLSKTQILSKKFIENNAAYGILESITPPWSIPAWNSLFSGVKPAKLGIFSFIKRCGSSLVPALSELDEQVYIWDLVSMYGRKVIAVNIPCVSKAIPVNGYFVAGFLTDRKRLAYPDPLNEKLLRYGYIVDITDLRTLTDEEFLETCIKITVQETVLFLNLAREVDWSLGIIVYTCPDRIQHRFLKIRFSFVEKYYEVLDKCVAKLLDNTNIDHNTITFIVSDHGFKIPKAAFSVNAWLMSRGFLSVKESSLTKRIERIIRYNVSNNYLLLTAMRKFIRALSKFLRRKPRIINSRDVMCNVFEDSGVIKGAYMPSEDGVIYILNTSKSLRKLLPKKIAEELSKSVPDIRINFIREQTQTFDDKAPDLILESDSMAFSTDPVLPVKLKVMRSTHSRQGVFIAIGPRGIISPGPKDTPRIVDIAPTLLYCLSIPIPTYVDGRVIAAIFTEKFLLEKKLQYRAMHYDEAKLLVKIQRLKIGINSRGKGI